MKKRKSETKRRGRAERDLRDKRGSGREGESAGKRVKVV